MAPIFLVDFEEFKPPDELIVRQEDAEEVLRQKLYGEEDLAFATKVFNKSGLGRHATYLPPSIHPVHCEGEPRTDLDSAEDEARLVLFGALSALMSKTGLRPKDIDILVTTCSIFCPTPSMASLVVNHFKMRGDVQSYHLGGMGCSNGVIAVNLVRDLLKANPNSNAVLLTTEIVTPCFYAGRDRHRMVANLLFRMGASACLFSDNEGAWGGRAKYELAFSHRIHIGSQDDAFQAIRYSSDAEGINGIYLGKNVVTEASRALTKAMWAAGPHVLTLRQKLEWLAHQARRRLAPKRLQGAPGGDDDANAAAAHEPAYAPSFAEGVQHFLLHAGGAKVLDGLGKALRLNERHLEPSRAVLHDYGNVSSSTTWYTLGWIESVRGVKRGDKVLQVGVGSGIKCGVNVWRARRDIKDVHEAWEHRVPDEAAHQAREARARPAVLAVDATHARRAALVSRLLFVLFMLLAFALWQLVLLPAASGGVLSAGHAASSLEL